MKTAIYARFSSTLQDERSVDDQVRICRERAEREGWEVVEVFADYAISGAVRDRPGLNDLMKRCGEFDVIMAEAMDRISRHQADIATIYETMKFNSAKLFTLSEGWVSEIHIGFTGTMSALFRTNLADKIRRGQKGRVAAGRIPGSICYGYRKVARLNAAGEGERGLREIVPEEAAVVLRICEEFVAGQSALSIVRRLNEEGVPSPTGRAWGVSMINGDPVRLNGILRNEIYNGVLIYNRTRMVRDPESRRRVPRVNPQEDWVRQEMPALRIVPADLWQAVQARHRANDGWTFNRVKRPKRLLSGLIQCGVCGANYGIVSADLWGCCGRRSKGNCSNGRKITTDALESRVLEGLSSRLLDPELVRLFIKRFHAYNAKAQAQESAARIRLERKLAEVKAKVDRLVTAFANGGGEFEEIREVMANAKAERQNLERALEELDAHSVVPLHPRIGEQYQRAVKRLSKALAGSPEARIDAVPAIRSLIDSIRLYPRTNGRGVDIEITGRMANVINLATGKELDIQLLPPAAPTLQVVAEDRYALKSRIAVVRV